MLFNDSRTYTGSNTRVGSDYEEDGVSNGNSE